MASNTIPVRVADFLKEHPPFSLLSRADNRAIAERVIVQYCATGQTIFEQGSAPLDHFFLIREGTVDLMLSEMGSSQLIDRCGEGEVFGVRALLAKDHYSLSATAGEETLLFAIPTIVFEPYLKGNAAIAYYLATCFAAGVRSREGGQMQGRIFIRPSGATERPTDITEIQQLPRKDNPLTCTLDTTIQQAARLMVDRRVGSIIVIDGQRHPIGIITYKDMARKVASGDAPISDTVDQIMSAPVHTIDQLRTAAEAQIKMLRFGIHHLVVTLDGTPNSPVQGVVSNHDLLVLQGNSPAVIIREIQRSQRVEQLEGLRTRAEQLLLQYLHQEVSIAYIAEIMSQVNDAIIERVIETAVNNRPSPPVDFCWLALGSEGRKEQLLRTDQDNALVFADVPAQEYDGVKAYFLDLAKAVTTALNDCGFEYCPADMMASNARWCLSLSEWQQQFSQWISEPGPQELMYASIFFDYRPVYGEAALARALTQHIFDRLDSPQLFLHYLAQQATQSLPPLSFFRNFIVESNGEHKNGFDLKKRAMMPLTDIARILTLEQRMHGLNSTIERFEHLATLKDEHQAIYEMAADAYEVLMRIRALQGLRNKDSGRFVSTEDLTKMQRALLRNSFRPVKRLQESLRLRYQLSLLG